MGASKATENSSRSLESTQGHALRIRTRSSSSSRSFSTRDPHRSCSTSPRGKRDRKRREPDRLYGAHTASGPGSVFYFEGLRGVHGLMLERLSLPDRGCERPARTKREKKRSAHSQSCRGERRAGQQE